MGKSGKKNKSEKINALRKQYDAFLEEDKKRKDRNEYILGRMETMRSCTCTLVHVSSKPYRKKDQSDYPSPPKCKGSLAHISNSVIALPTRSHVTPKFANITYDEQSLLREISKKYFLIPKVMSNDLYNVNYKENDPDPTQPGDADWKSKYNILDELKRAEKEDQSNIQEKNNNLDDLHENRNSVIPKESNEKSIVENKSAISLELTPSKPQTDMFEKPNKEVSFKNVEIKPNENNEEQVDKTWTDENIGVIKLNMEKQDLVSQSNKSHEVDLPANSSPKEYQLDDNIKQDTIFISSNNKIKEIKESNESHEKLTSSQEPISSQENKKYLPEEKNGIEINESQDNTSNYTLNKVNTDQSPIAICDNNMQLTNENTMEVNNENDVFSVKNIENINEFVNENMVKAQGVSEEVSDHLEGDTGHSEYQHQESDFTQIQNITSEVNDELETEQKEMFYGEDNEKGKEYNENDDTTYQAENENYINQDYSYYNESQKEQVYPTEINEHEESTERYDPNYEQQYINNYDDTMNTEEYQSEQYNVDNSYEQQQNMYDQEQGQINYEPENSNYNYAPPDSAKDAEPSQNVYYSNAQEKAQYEAQQVENTEMVDQPNIAYDASEEYDAQQEYLTMHTDPQPIENVEQQLDVEDGYLPNSNIVTENLDYQEQVIDETTPEVQQTDINVK